MKINPIIIWLMIIIIFLPKLTKSQEIHVDHVITVVKDINKAINSYKDLGFTIKNGHLHPNGLINAHIKFSNNTSYELMSLQGEATDEMAQKYAALLKDGEGGVYVAISGISTDSMEVLLSELKIKFNTIKGRNWNYITFSKNRELSHFFFIETHITVHDSEYIFKHKNQSVNIQNIYVEGSKSVKDFLYGIGLKSINNGETFLSKTGNINIIPVGNINSRSRIKSISFGKKDSSESIKISNTNNVMKVWK